MSVVRARKPAHVRFDPPIKARRMAINGSWSADCVVMEVSETGAQLECTADHLGPKEFLLFFTIGGPRPVFRRCSRRWLDGIQMEVEFRPSSFFLKHMESDR